MNVRGLINRGYELERAGCYDAALEIYLEAWTHDRSNFELLIEIGELQYQAFRFNDARKSFARAWDLRPDSFVASRLALCYIEFQKFEDAYRVLDRALAIESDSSVLRGTKASALFYEGRYGEALETIESVLGRSDVGWHTAVAYSQIAGHVGQTEAAIALLQRVIETDSTNDGQIVDLRFRLVRLLDSVERFDDAWAEAELANGAVSRGFDPDSFRGVVDRLIADWDRERVSAFLTPRVTSEQPVFIVGMPRSGSTLGERVLSAHPRVHAGGELGLVPNLVASLSSGGSGVNQIAQNQETVDGMADTLTKRYLKIGGDADRVIDKQLENIMHLGFISMLLPGARVIRTRRDPLDTCLSCYFQHFRGRAEFSHDLDHLGVYHRQLDRLLDHWTSVLPLEVYELSYERLIADQVGVTRELLEFVGLDWDESCLRFFETDQVSMTASVDQVNRPIYSGSVARHKSYERHLGPLRQSLGLSE